MSDSINSVEILVNLIYLAKHSVDDPEQMIGYLDQAEEYALQLGQTLHEHGGIFPE